MLKFLLGLSLALGGLVALAGCDSAAPPPISAVTALPAGGNVILDLGQLMSTTPGTPYGLDLYLVDPASGAMQRWAIARPLEQPASHYGTALHGASWSQARSELLIGGLIGNTPTLFVVGRDGQTTDLPLWGAPTVGPGEWYGYAWSPDGRQIAYNFHGFAGANDPADDVYIQDATSSPPRRVSKDLHGRGPTWSPDGTHLAFYTFHYPAALYRVAATGGAPQLLLDGFRSLASPAWSPDGTTIAFLGRRTDGDPQNLWVMDTAGGGLRAVVPLPAKLDQDADGVAAFAWAPDSRRFVVLSDHGGPCSHNLIEGGGSCDSRLYLVNADGSGLARLGAQTQSRYSAWLTWLP